MCACVQGVADDPGINQRALRLLFSEVSDKAPDWEYNITVSMVEIYNETLRLVSHTLSCLSCYWLDNREINDLRRTGSVTAALWVMLAGFCREEGEWNKNGNNFASAISAIDKCETMTLVRR